MPIYEYECKKCGQLSEVWQKFSDPPLTKCGSCKGKLRRIISQNSFHLKGTGWYVTDYASKGGSAAKNKSEKDTTGSNAKPSESTASKESSASPTNKGEA